MNKPIEIKGWKQPVIVIDGNNITVKNKIKDVPFSEVLRANMARAKWYGTGSYGNE